MRPEHVTGFGFRRFGRLKLFQRLLQALAGEHYYLQYLIYLVALRRFLRLRLSDFRNEQLGGAFYLFLRGMPQAGIYFTRPSDALLDALDNLFAEGKP